jgi:hypothetical protein
MNRFGCPKGSKKIDGKCRSKKILCYHSRCGHPILHTDEKNKIYIMARKPGGGTKRIYLNKKGDIPKKLQVKKGKKKRLYTKTNGYTSKNM